MKLLWTLFMSKITSLPKGKMEVKGTINSQSVEGDLKEVTVAAVDTSVNRELDREEELKIAKSMMELNQELAMELVEVEPVSASVAVKLPAALRPKLSVVSSPISADTRQKLAGLRSLTSSAASR